MENSVSEAAAPKIDENKVKPHNASFKFLSIIAFLLGIISLAGVITLGIIQNNASQNERHRVSRLHALLTQAQTQLTQQQQSLSNIETSLQAFSLR